jgi:tRNA A-37 threonylcarbamoyl transferase component Bud32
MKQTVKIMAVKAQTPPKSGFKKFLNLRAKLRCPAVQQLLTPPSSRSNSPTSGSRTLSSGSSSDAATFTELSIVEEKYGKLGRVLGDGATAIVQVLTHPTDGSAVAVKRFRCRRPLEDEKSRARKIITEFTIASALHHVNIIRTLDIIQDRSSYFQIMEYAPYGLFEAVISGKMEACEITCTWLQIVEGANYMHRMGVAHRDLKLENVVVSGQGVMKIIDFGSAWVYCDRETGEVMVSRGECSYFATLMPAIC